MSPRPAKLGSLNRAVRQINPEVLEWAFAHPSPTRYYIREEGGRYSIRGLCLRVGARVIWFGHRQGGGWTPIVQARPNMSPTEIDQARRQVREALSEAQDRPASGGVRMTVLELGAIYLQDLEATRGAARGVKLSPLPCREREPEDLPHGLLAPTFGATTLRPPPPPCGLFRPRPQAD